MAVVMKMRWEGVTPEQYDEVRDKVGWEQEVAKGGIHHVAWFEGGAFNAVDAWESPEAFQMFVDERLMPAVQEVGVAGEPQVEIFPAYRVWDPVHGEAIS